MRCPHCHHIIDKIPLTVNMQRVFDYIKKYSEKNNLAPTFDEIRTGCKLNNKSEVARYVMSLESRGWIAKERYKRRTIQII